MGAGDWAGADEEEGEGIGELAGEKGKECGGEEDTKTRKERERASRRDRNGRVVEVVQGPGAVAFEEEAGPAKSGAVKTRKSTGARKVGSYYLAMTDRVRHPLPSVQAAWSNLVSTQPKASSSDFDSSDSANDVDSEANSEVEGEGEGDAAPPRAESSKAAAERARSASPKGKGVQRSLSPARAGGAVVPASIAPASAPPTLVAGGVGSALKRGPDGQVVQPRVVRREGGASKVRRWRG